MRPAIPLFAGLLCSLAAAAYAANGSAVSVAVKDANGMPVRDAVVMIYPKAGWGSARGSFADSNTMTQRDISFQPGTLIVAKGSTVRFPNEDRVRHSIYSFSKPAKFQIALYGRDQTKTKNFAIAGAVALGCNIHDEMKGYIKVVDTPFAAKTDHNGLLTIRDLPTGAATMKIWHPANRVRGGETVTSVSLASGANRQTVKLALR
ncbi:methylamine utilization protein [Parasphingorhabdus sp.]|uniref:methylamine utilization protein n=1 Tax=Parasphingorhabdus sp. TaxID=2709688 RepID=UPI003001D075